MPPTPAAPGLETRIARQPILDARDRIGYELLYRGDSDAIVDDVQKTTRSVVASLLEFGLDRLVGTSKAWFNVSTDFLMAGHHRALPAERVVLEILEHQEPTPQLRACIGSAQAAGYTVALDDLEVNSQQRSLLDLVELVKVDLTIEGAYGLIHELAGRGHTVVAEKVETRAEHERAGAAGAALFQGYYFARPSLQQMGAAPPAALLGVRALASITDPDVPFEKVIGLVTTDPALASRVLVATNSSSVGLRRRVESVHEAVVFLGAERVSRIALLCVLDGLRSGAPRELLRIGLVRAEVCRRIAGDQDAALADAAHTCGLLSVLDALTGCAMTSEFLERCGLDDRLVDALVDRTGTLGAALTSAIALVDETCDSPDSDLNAHYLAAVRAADDLLAVVEVA